MTLAGGCQVYPSDGVLRLKGPRERELFDRVAQEQVKVAGTPVELYQFDRTAATRDPLYDEVILGVFAGPYQLSGWVQWPEVSTEVRAEGYRLAWPGELWLARADIEQLGARRPRDGDVVKFWDLPYFEESSVSYPGATGAGYYFNITTVVDDGHLHDSPDFVGFKCTLQRNTEFTPERRLNNG